MDLNGRANTTQNSLKRKPRIKSCDLGQTILKYDTKSTRNKRANEINWTYRENQTKALFFKGLCQENGRTAYKLGETFCKVYVQYIPVP